MFLSFIHMLRFGYIWRSVSRKGTGSNLQLDAIFRIVIDGQCIITVIRPIQLTSVACIFSRNDGEIKCFRVGDGFVHETIVRVVRWVIEKYGRPIYHSVRSPAGSSALHGCWHIRDRRATAGMLPVGIVSLLRKGNRLIECIHSITVCVFIISSTPRSTPDDTRIFRRYPYDWLLSHRSIPLPYASLFP